MRRFIIPILSILFVSGGARADVPDGEKKAIEQIRQQGGLVLELAQNDNHLEVAYLETDGKFSDAYLAPLKDLSKRLVHLNLRGQPVTDAQLVYLKDLTGLTQLHLEKTKVTDKGLVSLKGLVNLEYLNLYGTEVTDAGLAQLEGLKKLKHLYLWQTKVTDAGAAKLKKAVAGVDINRGLDEKPKTETKVADKPKDAKKPDAKPTDAKKPEPKKPEAKKPAEKQPEAKKPAEKK
jgi:hypothetical protein